MGALIPNGNDAEVISQLNSVFTGRKLAKLRKHIKNKKDDVFHGERALHRVSHRLKIAPTSGAKARGRWYVFLRDLIGPGNQKKILKGIRDAVNDANCEGIRFWARLEPGLASGYDIEVVADRADSAGQHWVTITMLCDHEIDPYEKGDPRTPPADPGEVDPPHPAADDEAVAVLGSSATSKATKKPGNKAAKRPAKKPGKKPAKKKKK
jgi:hypothetical protein